jgi:1,4-alpha-glucan branching enzyme
VGRKRPYDPAEARAQVDHDVAHFVDAVRDQLLHAHEVRGQPGLVVAAYDTELFGHWWHEGPMFVGKAIRALRRAGITVTTVEKALADGHVAGDLDLAPGSWGAGKDYSVWDGPAVRQIAHENEWLQRRWLDVLGRERAAGRLHNRRPDLDQLLQTLWHALSSDWAFLVTRGQSVDYARRRADEHRRDFHVLAQLIEDGRRSQAIEEARRQGLQDNAFPALDARLGAAPTG